MPKPFWLRRISGKSAGGRTAAKTTLPDIGKQGLNGGYRVKGANG
jgi:hypothetical protein